MKPLRMLVGITALTVSSYLFAVDHVNSPVVASVLLFAGLVVLFVGRA